MTEQTGQTDMYETISAWADITLKIWRDKIVALQVYDTGELMLSLKNELTRAAGNSVEKVEFTFKLYGVFQDLGVGREISRGNGGDLGFTPNRKRREWYSKVFYREVMRLKEILIDRYGKASAQQVVESLRPEKDLKYARAKGRLNI
jgi:hypothetical protein